jgi:hypothetical protein
VRVDPFAEEVLHRDPVAADALRRVRHMRRRGHDPERLVPSARGDGRAGERGGKARTQKTASMDASRRHAPALLQEGTDPAPVAPS